MLKKNESQHFWANNIIIDATEMEGRDRCYVPGYNRIHGDAPVIPDLVEISVANPTVQDFYGNIVYAVFPVWQKQKVKTMFYAYLKPYEH